MTAGLVRDAVVVSRPVAPAGADRYGRPVSAVAVVYEGRGTWGSPSARDREFLTKMGQVVDASVALTWGEARKGDLVVVRANRWRVEAVIDVRTHWRLMLAWLASVGYGSYARGYAA